MTMARKKKRKATKTPLLAKIQTKGGFSAGVYEQTGTGWGLVTWSHHSTRALAEKAARSYAKRLSANGANTGGAYSWSAWHRGDGGQAIEVRT